MQFNAKQSTTSIARTSTKETPKVKVVVVGACSVGKTSISTRFANDLYDPRSPTTLGAAYLQRTFEHPLGNVYKFEIWDTTGQEKYRSIAKIYYKQAKIAILVYDVADQASLSNLKTWAEEVIHNSSKDIILAVVGNKIDLVSTHEQLSKANEREAKIYAKSIGAIYHRTSAKEDIGLNELFCDLCDKFANQSISDQPRSTIIALSGAKAQRQSKCCSG